ncbi:MAG: DinB family protein [Acidobacteriota bacterium]
MSETSDLLERFRRGAELLAMATTGAAGPVLDFKAEGYPLTVRQIVCHLADAEAVGVMRFRQILAEENPTLQYFDDDAWAHKLDYSKRKISVALETFRRLRSDNHELLKDQPDQAFQRSGTHSKDGAMTLRQVTNWYAMHLEDHVREIQAVRALYKEFRTRELAEQGAQT